MNVILLFFALPVATIILAIVLEKILRCPILVAATFFAVFLIVAFAVFDATFLIFVIAYTIIAFITAIIAELFFVNCCEENKKCNSNCNCIQENVDTVAVNVRDNQTGNKTSWCCYRR